MRLRIYTSGIALALGLLLAVPAGWGAAQEAPDAEATAVVVPNVELLQWGQGMDNTFMGALTVALRALGEDITYEYLMGVSGAAFKFHFHLPQWCPSSADATCGFDCTQPALEALGYSYRSLFAEAGSPEAEQLRAAVVESIDRGTPVVAIDLIEVPDWGVITGYRGSGSEFLCRTYYDESAEYSLAKKQPWGLVIIDAKGERPARRDSVANSLQIAVGLAHTESFGDYASGFAAFERWIADLENESLFTQSEASSGYTRELVNAWVFYSLLHSRRVAADYLRFAAGEFEPAIGEHLTNAADIYEEMVQVLEEGRQFAPFAWELEEGATWNADMRHAEAGILRHALERERSAVNELTEALALLQE